MKTSVIILAWNGINYLGHCLDAVVSQGYADLQIIVVDNGSTDGSADFVAEHYPQVRLIRNERNLGFAAGNNVGLRAAAGDALVLLNQDTVVHAGWLAALVNALRDPSIGMVGCKLLYPDGTIQHAGACLKDVRGGSEHIGRHEPDRGQYEQPRDIDFVTGASVALTRSTLAKVGMLDEGFGPAYHEDADWCYRVRAAGLRVVYWPAAVVTHYESTSSQTDSYAHQAIYHYGRLRLLFKHKPLDWLTQEFAPAEQAGIQQMGRVTEVMAIRAACMRLLLSLPEIVTFRLQPVGNDWEQISRQEWEALSTLVMGLREACVQSEGEGTLRGQLEQAADQAIGAEILRQAGVSEPPAATLIPEPLWTKLLTEGEIREQPFHSDAPLVGESIAAFREAWNNVATRWYVLPLLQQQTNFNRIVASVATVLAEKLNEINMRQTRIAVTQVAILNILQQVLDSLDGQRRDSAQHIREINQLMFDVARLRQQIMELEKTSEENT